MLQVQAGAVALPPEAGWQSQRDMPEGKGGNAKRYYRAEDAAPVSSLQPNDSSQVKQQISILILLPKLSTNCSASAASTPWSPGHCQQPRSATEAMQPQQGVQPQPGTAAAPSQPPRTASTALPLSSNLCPSVQSPAGVTSEKCHR